MFDANARHIPQGELFFVEVHALDESNKVYQKLLREGEVYLCERKGDSPDDSEFKLYLNKSMKDYIIVKVDFNSEDFDYCSFFVYSGRPNGEGFIDNNYKTKAINFLGGEWLC